MKLREFVELPRAYDREERQKEEGLGTRMARSLVALVVPYVRGLKLRIAKYAWNDPSPRIGWSLEWSEFMVSSESVKTMWTWQQPLAIITWLSDFFDVGAGCCHFEVRLYYCYSNLPHETSKIENSWCVRAFQPRPGRLYPVVHYRKVT